MSNAQRLNNLNYQELGGADSTKKKSPQKPFRRIDTKPMEGLKQAHEDIVLWMYQSHGPVADYIFSMMEGYFNLPRVTLAYIASTLLLLYMSFGQGAQFLSNLIGFVYPCYASVKAIRTPGQEDDTHWLIYWTTFGSFFLFDSFVSVFFQWFPFYFILKSVFLIYLWLPQTMGAQYLYRHYIEFVFTWIEKKCIDKYANE